MPHTRELSEPVHHPLLVAGPACERSILPPWARLTVTLAVLFALKWALPALSLPEAAQVLILLAAATGFARAFWWSCRADRRGPMILIGSLWLAGLAKILL